MKVMKILISALVALLVIAPIAIFAAGAAEEEAAAAEEEFPPGPPSEPEFPFVEEPTSIVYATYDNYYAPASYTDDLELFNVMAERTGVEIEWQVAPSSDIRDVWRTRLAAGADLPDLMNGWTSIFPPFIAADMFVDMQPYLDSYGYYMQQLFDDFPAAKGVATHPNGSFYYVGAMAAPNKYQPVISIRGDWLEKLGLPKPTTMDELLETLIAFKENEVNGTDEVYFGMPNHWELQWTGEHWGIKKSWSGNFHPYGTDSIELTLIMPEYREFLTYLSDMYAAGVLDPNIASTNAESWRQLAGNNQLAATHNWMGGIPNLEELARTQDPNAEYVALIPLEGPHGENNYEMRGPYGSTTWMLKDGPTEDKALVFRFLDWFFASEEANRMIAFGIEGTHWEMVGGKPQIIYDVWSNLDGGGRTFGGQGNYATSWFTLPEWPGDQLYAVDEPKLVGYAESLTPFLEANYPGGALFRTEEEQNVFDRYWEDMSTYYAEMRIKFILGEEDIRDDDVWNEYVETFYDMGLDRILEVEQAKLDRYLEAIGQETYGRIPNSRR